MDKAAFLARFPALRPYLDHMPEELFALCVMRRLEPGQLICRQGDQLRSVSLICSGQVRILKEFESGHVFQVETKRAGDLISVVAMLAGMAFVSMGAEALTETLLLEIDLAVFDRWLHADADFLLLLAQDTAKQFYRNSFNRGLEMFYPSTYILLGYLLSEGAGEAPPFAIQKTRPQIKDSTGLSVKTINRTIKKLSAEGYLSVVKGKIHMSAGQYGQIKKAYADKFGTWGGWDDSH